MTADQLDEVDELVERHGVGSFKFYMFYKGLNLSASSTRGSDYTMADNYDLGHLYLLMEKVAKGLTTASSPGKNISKPALREPGIDTSVYRQSQSRGHQGT